MKKLLFLFVLLISLNAKGQYVTIPDTAFVSYLQQNCPTCMNGNLMDTTCNDLSNTHLIMCQNRGINDLTGVQYFPNLQYLYCAVNNLISLPFLPNSIETLVCNNNQLTSLPPLPNSISELKCGYNQLTSLPTLPNSLQNFSCNNNQLTTIPILPNTIIYFYCDNNLLNNLPALPPNLIDLDCYSNYLTSLPTLPNSLLGLYCQNNQLIGLPILPSALVELFCNDNQISCFPTFPDSLSPGDFSIYNNPFTCLPNYISGMDSLTLTYPLCSPGSSNNPYGCNGTTAITGYVFKDLNTDCIKTNVDYGLKNIPIKIYDNAGNLLDQSASLANGVFFFASSLGTFKISLDTTNKPFQGSCAFGIDSIVTNTAINPLVSNVNFAIGCKPGHDIGTQSVFHQGPVFPGQQHRLYILAGDLSQWYQLNCASGISGQVQITATGPVTYNGITSNALTPSISGNTYTYNITDFGNVNIQNAFGLYFTTDTTAQAGDYIYVNITVTPTNGDNNTSNNSYTYYYQVSNSLDPNLKEVYPTNVSPPYNDWFTYTIHFQNTGNAAAHNIRLLDTLSNNLDLNTFEVINYSHYNKVYLNGNILTVTYPNIMLPDSLSDPEGSQGFVQYRIKSKPGLQLGTQIKNTAYIYFDYNSPVITNTAISEFTTTSIKNIKTNQLQVYPNPTTGKLTIKTKENKASINLYNQLGEKLIQMNNISQQTEIDMANFPAGMYYLQLRTVSGTETVKVVKE